MLSISDWGAQIWRWRRQGGPCGVLAPLNATTLRHLLFPAGRPRARGGCAAAFPRVTQVERHAALARAIAEVAWRAGGGVKGTLAALNPDAPELANVADLLRGGVPHHDAAAVAKLEVATGVVSSSDALARLVVTREARSLPELVTLAARWAAPSLLSGAGALLVLLSAVLSRGGAEACAADRDPDDQASSLVTLPFGHCGQEVVGLMLTGRCVSNVFDGDMDVGGGLLLKGVSGDVEVGFLTLLESLSYCTVGDFLKHPRWPVWVVGSESHYTVVLSLAPLAGAGLGGGADQDAAGQFERKLRRAFDAKDTGGGGFVAPEVLPAILEEGKLAMTDAQRLALGESGIVLWADFIAKARELAGFAADDAESAQDRQELRLTLWHLNGLAKPAGSGSGASSGGAAADSSAAAQPMPRAVRIELVVPPKFSATAADADLAEALRRSAAEAATGGAGAPAAAEVHSQLSDVLRTRWPRARCSWEGAEKPSLN